MPKQGDQFIVELKKTNIDWGTYRNTNSRPQITGECYIPIPSSAAHQYGIFNSKHTQGKDVLGQNIFNARSTDGYFVGIVKSSGNSRGGDPYAKNLSGHRNLRAFNDWFNQMNVTVGTKIKVEWISSKDIILTIL